MSKTQRAYALILAYPGQWVLLSQIARGAGTGAAYIIRSAAVERPPGIVFSLHTRLWRGRELPAWYAYCENPAALREWLTGGAE